MALGTIDACCRLVRQMPDQVLWKDSHLATSLTKLSINQNRIKVLPDEIKVGRRPCSDWPAASAAQGKVPVPARQSIKHMRVVSWNVFDLDTCMGALVQLVRRQEMRSLETLCCYDNTLTSLPKTICNMQSLTQL